MAGKPTRASQLRTVTLTWALKNRNRKGPCVPATDGGGVNSADHRCPGWLRNHRFLGPGARCRRLACAVRRREQQQLLARGGGPCAAVGMSAVGPERPV